MSRRHRTLNHLLKSLPHLLLAGLCVVILFTNVGAQNQNSQSGGVSIGGRVGTNTLSLTGYHSPYASIILKTSDGTFLASTTADAKGYFTLSNVLINASELTYCFQAVDFKRLGTSESCITIPGPIVGDITYTDIFLPPTIGLSKKQINAGEDAIIYGYSMPGAVVYITINDETITVYADATGYYTYIYEDVPEGTFTITASASFEEEASLEPTNNVILESLSLPQQITDTGKKTVDKAKETVKKFVPIDLWPYLLLALILLAAIGFLLYKLKFGPWMIIVDFFKRKKKMHHDWFLDKW